MTRLPSLLTTDDFPLAELIALRLDGQVFLLDDCGAPIDLPTTAATRAAVLLTVMPRRMIAEQRSAAWVWGALPCLPRQHQGCVDTTARVRPTLTSAVEVRQVVIEPGDVCVLEGLAVTSPIRTAIDLARFTDRWGDDDRATAMELMRIGRFSAADCVERLDRRHNLPNKRRAIERLRQISPN